MRPRRRAPPTLANASPVPVGSPRGRGGEPQGWNRVAPAGPTLLTSPRKISWIETESDRSLGNRADGALTRRVRREGIGQNASFPWRTWRRCWRTHLVQDSTRLRHREGLRTDRRLPAGTRRQASRGPRLVIDLAKRILKGLESGDLRAVTRRASTWLPQRAAGRPQRYRAGQTREDGLA